MALAKIEDGSPGGERLNRDDVVVLADMFRMLGDPTRLRVVLACLDHTQSVGHIAERLGLSQSSVSHHLRLLRAARIVAPERRGKYVYYGAADDHIRCVIEDMVAHVGEPVEDEA